LDEVEAGLTPGGTAVAAAGVVAVDAAGGFVLVAQPIRKLNKVMVKA
jgi:hypothetical protein